MPKIGNKIGVQCVQDSLSTYWMKRFDLYANFFGADNVFEDGETLAKDSNGIIVGSLTIKDKSTGQIELLNNYLYGFGDGDYTDHIISGTQFYREFGKVVRISMVGGSLVHNMSLGVCKPDLSDCANSDGIVIMNTADSINAKVGATSQKIANKSRNTEYEFLFFVGGFDVNGQPYRGENKANFSYGCMIFMRGALLPYWSLIGYTKSTAEAALVPFVAFYSTNTSPYGKGAIVKMMQYKISDLNINQVTIAQSNNDQITLDANDCIFQYIPILANSEEISIYFCIDAYDNPQTGYRLKIARSTTVVHTLYKITDGSESVVGTSQAVTYATTKVYSFRMLDGSIIINDLANITNIDLTDYLTNNKAKIVNGANSYLKDFTVYKLGRGNYYQDLLYYAEPFFTGANAPGFGLLNETRKGHYFDVCSQSINFGTESIGAVMYLTNGSSSAIVKFRSHSEKRFITELTKTINLRYAYTGTNAVIYIGSDPHFGYAANNAPLVYRDLIIPDLGVMGITHCFILGDIVHDTDAYDSYIASKGLYPLATWKELNGNHDIVATFKTKLGYVDESHVETIGNCSFIMCGGQSTNITIDTTFLSDSLDAAEDKNCFIMTHAGRKNTTATTDTGYCEPTDTIETVLATRKFIAWFAGHQHGWIANTRKLTQAKYLNLGDNN